MAYSLSAANSEQESAWVLQHTGTVCGSTVHASRHRRRFELLDGNMCLILLLMISGITECQIVSWSIKPGDKVEQFDPICEVSSDKATVEVCG